ncbi:CNT_HP2_G0000750.mRNA.1.CDS.1 [Saccharomyces cerevisiae]|nr:CKB_HP2_G0000630.mRNA.1.CDS.1 [Saccharomyces cerevisiae]CAI5229526.1 CNT_HP2_G0000750.mRNA.1.CDS.1 [Saccharomyces cerevisiae]CAI6380387.1 CKB_HP2_G0000630.mRNA.1.CDS.1 [Saccharomyces cerevisiae]CAI6384322.1 CNT_HP2_G0000750.mRNA.1.CDS.1 [Saccharomyces cerevisiae]
MMNSGSHSDSSSNSAEDTQSSVSAGKTSNGPNNFDSIRSDPILMAYTDNKASNIRPSLEVSTRQRSVEGE